ncbi:putative disease resistance protein RGA3 [Ziziphus jujuba]|uniref:Disease resistance protein RGA3 n=1 Tax=Ziziphus jujuba TaxID=326968 RepID=A0ABM3ILP3_ZIZJJ|nr:putative disease resistance protein RGA3 [Ziziphus jujuba]
MSHKIKEIREALDEIQENRTFSLEVRYEEKELVSPISRESHSYVREEEVTGRDDDRKAILEYLVNVETIESVSFIAIVGIGGLGKTTLARLVYDDDVVKKHFDLTLWVCVSDAFDLKSVIGKIIKSASNWSIDQNLELDQLQRRLRQKIDGKKYFLVLDDVWNEDSTKWDSLSSLLMGGARGSRVLVTTRSEKVARVTRPFQVYHLKVLDQDKSWSLFEKQAFGQRLDIEKSDFVALGKEIVEKCKGLPLAIKSIGSILYFKTSKADWLFFKDNELAKAIRQEDNIIIPTLKLSYNHLPSYLKHCFAYCSLFPKDHEFEVQMLIKLWMAQGFIKADQNQCLEDIGYGYFLDLLWRSFFQEATKDEWGNIWSCKMHDLMHDVANLVAGKGSVLIDKDFINFDENLVHVSFPDLSVNNTVSFLKNVSPLLRRNYKLRTFYSPPFIKKPWYDSESDLESVLTNCMGSCFKLLRSLALGSFRSVKKLPSSLGELKHLRYLDLSHFDEIQELPNSITKLQNLQTLNLEGCRKLSSLPKDIHKMVSLRHLLLIGCRSLSHMPCRLGELTCLQTLNMFVVAADRDIKQSRRPRRKNMSIGEVGELRNLNSLRVLRIENLRPDIEGSENSKLQEKQHLEELTLSYSLKFDGHIDDHTLVEKYEKSLKLLQPHPNLKTLLVRIYMGEGLASWVTSLNNLVQLSIWGCTNLKSLPEAMGNHSSLRHLSIWGCPNLISLPEGQMLRALRRLTIISCPFLLQRYNKTSGEDWPKIAHIPNVEIY